MLKNNLDKNGNELKGATVITRFVKENGGLESLFTKVFEAGHEKGREQGAKEALIFVDAMLKGSKERKNNINF